VRRSERHRGDAGRWVGDGVGGAPVAEAVVGGHYRHHRSGTPSVGSSGNRTLPSTEPDHLIAVPDLEIAAARVQTRG
jgi:hypothetical protein